MSGIKIGVLISGGGTNLQAIIDNIKSGYINGQIELIVSNKKDAYGLERGRLADIESIYINTKDFKNADDYNKRLIEEFNNRDVDLIVLAGYLKILSDEFIKEYSKRIINIHPSLIPSFSGKDFYGKKVHEAALNRGVKVSGATVHFVDEGTDTGPIIMQDIVIVDENETIDSLQKKVLEVEHKLLVEAIKLYTEGKLHVDEGIVRIGG